MGKILTILCCALSALSAVLSGCNTAGCTELRSSVPCANFYSSTTGKAITVDSLQITGVGVPGDSVLYGPSQRLTQIYLPMPAAVDKVSWRLAYMQKALADYDVADTVTMQFERMPWFGGEECGAMYKYRITRLDYTDYVIDSVVLIDSLVSNVEQTTMTIYFRTN